MKVIAIVIYGWFGAQVVTCLGMACLVWLNKGHPMPLPLKKKPRPILL